MQNNDLNFFQQRGFGQTLGFGKKPALLVIDMMAAFTDPSLPLGASMDSEVQQINTLVDAAHENQHPVFFSIVCYDEADAADAGVWSRKMKALKDLRLGSSGVELDTRLHRDPHDIVFIKKYASCFFGTDFASRLQSRRIDTLIVTGCTTSGCVRASVVDAIQNGFIPIVPREAVADRSKVAHEQSLFDLQAKYCDVLSIGEVQQALRTALP